MQDRYTVSRVRLRATVTQVAIAAFIGTLCWLVFGLNGSFQWMTNPFTGIRIAYPAHWTWTRTHLSSCEAARVKGYPSWKSYGPAAPPASLAIRFTAIPADIYMLGPWAEDTAGEGERLLRAVISHKGYTSSKRVEWRKTHLLGLSAIELSGPREPGYWGSTVVALEGDNLLLFDAVAPTRQSFVGFQPTWKRLVRRAKRVHSGSTGAFLIPHDAL